MEEKKSRVWKHAPVIPALERQRKEDWYKSEANLFYIAIPRPVNGSKFVSKKQYRKLGSGGSHL